MRTWRPRVRIGSSSKIFSDGHDGGANHEDERLQSGHWRRILRLVASTSGRAPVGRLTCESGRAFNRASCGDKVCRGLRRSLRWGGCGASRSVVSAPGTASATFRENNVRRAFVIAVLIIAAASGEDLEHEVKVAQLEVDVERWWHAARTEVRVWDHSWLTPRMMCGLRFTRDPPSISGDRSHALKSTSDDSSLLEGRANESCSLGSKSNLSCSAGVGIRSSATRVAALSWIFDGTTFQRRAIDFYEGLGPPPLEEVWQTQLLSYIPGSSRFDVMPFADLIELKCGGVGHMANQIYIDFISHLAPPGVLLKYFQTAFQLHSRSGLEESADDIAEGIQDFEPMQQTFAAMDRSLAVVACTHMPHGRPDCETPEMLQRVRNPLVDIVIARCREDLQWVQDWFARILRDEWTPEVVGARIRLLVFERCEAPFFDLAAHENVTDEGFAVLAGGPLVEFLRRLGAVTSDSAAIDLREPPGFENVPYVYYCRSETWRDADFTMFLHGGPGDHLDMQTLDDVLRSLSLGTYGVQFLHLNVKRTPKNKVERCVKDLLKPAMMAWASDSAATLDTPTLPSHFATYCCSQFVVAQARIRRVSDTFWDTVWAALLLGTDSIEATSEQGNESKDGLPQTCRPAAKAVMANHHRHNSSIAGRNGLWAIVLERMWHWIFGEEADLPFRERDGRLPMFLRARRTRASVDGGPRGTVEDLVTIPDWGFDPGWWGTPVHVRNVTLEPMMPSLEPVPTRYFAEVGRYGWPMPDWVRDWFAEK
eukprot:TRINITY_DN43817_c0_g1_i1.p1 TRINITY_DN43817_c0_g1~~TRINITY_DN43817_c0_g1_i1.p1  ORF type:complete len:764 (+),score=101.17 TRINITY_DN43817_c0_g1_i1:46-2337(+)